MELGSFDSLAKGVSMTAALPDWNASIRSEHESTTTVESIVLALDGRKHSRPAIVVARKLSELYHAVLHVTYVGDTALDLKDPAGCLGFSAEEANDIVFEQGKGSAVSVVTELASRLRHALIILSIDTGGITDKDHFGSITESVFASRPKRTLLVPPDFGNKPWRPRRILLAHDGTPACHAATVLATELAARAEAEVIALHVAARGEARSGAPGSIPAPMYLDQPQHEWPAWAEEFMGRIIATGAPPSSVHFKFIVTGGRAGSEVAKVAREQRVDLVVMAWHGHWDRESCATRVVVRNSGCPVFLVYSAD
jgi:nucleotide-binding universal stress UspA family protein